MEALQRLYNRGSISTGYDIDNSVKLEADNSENFTRTPSSNSNRQTFTFSTWVKRTELGINGGLIEAYQDGSNFFLFAFTTNDQIVVYNIDSSVDYGYVYTPRFRDTSAWYHIVFVSDTTNSTGSDRYQLYVNGVRITDISQDYGTPPQNYNNNLNSTIAHNIGKRADGNTYNSCYLAETHLVDGTALAPTEFGEFDEDSGIWKPKQVTGVTYGTNGFYLDYADASDLGDDESGNGNDYTENNITSADQAVDSPTNNFAILSHAMQGYYEDQWSVISDGGTKFRVTEFDVWITTVSSIGVTKGKWYAEFQPTGARPNNMYGIASMEQLDNNSGYIYGGYLGESGESWGIGYYQTNGNLFKQQNSGYTLTTSFGSSISQNQKVGVAIDMDNHNLYIAINNTWQNSGDPTSGATGTGAISFDDTETVAFGLTGYSLGSGNDTIVSVNFGGYRTGGLPSINSTDANGYGVFRYAPPTGYYALCTKNLEEFG